MFQVIPFSAFGKVNSKVGGTILMSSLIKHNFVAGQPQLKDGWQYCIGFNTLEEAENALLSGKVKVFCDFPSLILDMKH